MDKESTKKIMNIFQKAIQSGYSCFPCKGKEPSVWTWKKYMTELPTITEAKKWMGNIAIVCGKVSGGVNCIDFDVKNGDRWDNWIAEVNNMIPDVLSKLYVETTPSGGYHVAFRANKPYKSKKLAANKDNLGMIETRGEGGYFICAPSNGYKSYFGKLSSLEKITDDEADILLSLCEIYNEVKKQEYKPVQTRKIKKNTCEMSAFDRYDNETNPCDILIKYGWKIVRKTGDKIYLRRPDKNTGISASWNAVPDRFYFFTTSTIFENEKVYKPYAVYTILEHNGNFGAAYSALKTFYKMGASNG